MKSNMYAVSLDSTWEEFGAHISGAREGVACAISAYPLSPAAANALTSTFASLGYGKAAATFVALEPGDGAVLVNASQLFRIIEGLDPLCMVVADKASSKAVAEAYRLDQVPHGVTRVLGRDAVFFDDFDSLLESSESKQRAWKLLKALPRYSDK